MKRPSKFTVVGGTAVAKGASLFDDLDALRVVPVEWRQGPSTKPWRRQFIMVPWQWQERLEPARRAVTYRLALWLLYEHWRRGGGPVVLSNEGLKRAKLLSRQSKWNALAELVRLGLVEVETHSGRSPRVTLCHLSDRRV
jgi:hypothetical protein